MKAIGGVALAFVMSAAVMGQESLPSNYRTTFENAWVKVTAVRYGPMEKVRAHAHTPYPTAYVYLHDGPPVIFRHVGGKGVAATRAATKAGAFRVYKGLDEVHEVENTGHALSEFLRVELKTAGSEPGTFFGKFERPSTASPDPIVHFNHSQVRISRLWIGPGQGIEIVTAAEPSLMIALASGAGLNPGDTRWIDPSSRAKFANASPASIDMLRVDFKTRPAETRR
jgi:hypothetical protein